MTPRPTPGSGAASVHPDPSGSVPRQNARMIEEIRLTDGTELAADIIVTATGLEVQMLGGGELFVDGEPVDITERLTYKAVLIEGVPNAAMIFGYTNASWTLKVDLAAHYICRLLAQLDGRTRAVAIAHGAGPLVSVFLIPQRLPKEIYVGTTVLVFTWINWIKMPLFMAQGLITRETLWMGLCHLPLIPLGVWAGVWLNRKFSERVFSKMVYGITFLAGLQLTFNFNWTHLFR